MQQVKEAGRQAGTWRRRRRCQTDEGRRREEGLQKQSGRWPASCPSWFLGARMGWAKYGNACHAPSGTVCRLGWHRFAF